MTSRLVLNELDFNLSPASLLVLRLLVVFIVFGTAVASTPFSLAGGKAAFGGIRGSSRMVDDDDDDEEEDNVKGFDDGRQKIGLVEDSITLDQARRIAMQSAWRGTGTSSS